MTARIWHEGDPEPVDHPPLVDAEGVTWVWSDDWDEGDYGYARRQVRHLAGVDGSPGVVLGPPLGMEWEDIVGEYGPMREATREEAESMTVTFEQAQR